MEFLYAALAEIATGHVRGRPLPAAGIQGGAMHLCTLAAWALHLEVISPVQHDEFVNEAVRVGGSH